MIYTVLYAVIVVVQGSTIVYVGNDECKQIEYYCTDQQLVCLTPAHAVSEGVRIS